MRAGLKRGGRTITLAFIAAIAMLGLTMGTAQAALFTGPTSSCTFVGSSQTNGSVSTFYNSGGCTNFRGGVSGKNAATGGYFNRVNATSSGPGTGVGYNYGQAIVGALHYPCVSGTGCGGQYTNAG